MLELKLIPEFPQEIIATDEVGRGPLGGPVVIGCVRMFIQNAEGLKSLLKTLRARGIKDSKLLSSGQRLLVFKKIGVEDLTFRQRGEFTIKGCTISYVTWDMDHDKIDEMNILGASLQGMKEAVTFLSDGKNIKTTVLIDGHLKLRWEKGTSPWNEIPIIKGDTKSLLIGLASIIAKEKRDGYMREIHELYPQYGFNSHYGYPTKAHRIAIKEFGPCPIHRKTFKGVKEFVRT